MLASVFMAAGNFPGVRDELVSWYGALRAPCFKSDCFSPGFFKMDDRVNSMGKRKKGRGRGRGPHGGPGPGPGGPGGRTYEGGGGRMRHRGRRYSNGEPQGMPYQDIEPVAENGEPLPVEPGSGVLELHPNGYGFLRNPDNNLTRERTDPFVPGTMIEKFRLREGVLINGMVQQGRRQQGPRLKEILDVDGMKPEDYPNVKTFDSLTPINPESWLRLETGPAAAHHPRHGLAHAAGQGPTGLDRRPAAHRQDHPLAADQPCDCRRTIPTSS